MPQLNSCIESLICIHGLAKPMWIDYRFNAYDTFDKVIFPLRFVKNNDLVAMAPNLEITIMFSDTTILLDDELRHRKVAEYLICQYHHLENSQEEVYFEGLQFHLWAGKVKRLNVKQYCSAVTRWLEMNNDEKNYGFDMKIVDGLDAHIRKQRMEIQVLWIQQTNICVGCMFFDVGCKIETTKILIQYWI